MRGHLVVRAHVADEPREVVVAPPVRTGDLEGRLHAHALGLGHPQLVEVPLDERALLGVGVGEEGAPRGPARGEDRGAHAALLDRGVGPRLLVPEQAVVRDHGQARVVVPTEGCAKLETEGCRERRETRCVRRGGSSRSWPGC